MEKVACKNCKCMGIPGTKCRCCSNKIPDLVVEENTYLKEEEIVEEEIVEEEVLEEEKDNIYFK